MIYTDGGARGNPGPSAIAFIATDSQGVTLQLGSRYIGIHTNNQAEYLALLMALQYALDVKATEVLCHLDSELVAKQLNGQYAVKNPELQKLNVQVKALMGGFKKIGFVNVPREHPQIARADGLVNKVLDEQARKR
ncbi:MAG: ribonuclease HI family protein [Candidatus Bathyarchaeota archaeon]|nr:ribonuclease HI family protein [Candidatus Bathyarchaeota archaeon]